MKSRNNVKNVSVGLVLLSTPKLHQLTVSSFGCLRRYRAFFMSFKFEKRSWGNVSKIKMCRYVLA